MKRAAWASGLTLFAIYAYWTMRAIDIADAALSRLPQWVEALHFFPQLLIVETGVIAAAVALGLWFWLLWWQLDHIFGGKADKKEKS